MTNASDSWDVLNQRYLTAGLERVRGALQRHIARMQGTPDAEATARASQHELPVTGATAVAPPALDRLCSTFGLSPFERDLLLLCAGVELDASFSSLCALAQGDPQRAYPTFGLALAALPGAHWSALTPIAPLRRWRLIEVGAGQALTLSPLRIDERVLHYLAGVPYLDERLAGILEPAPETSELAPSHRALAEQALAAWSQPRRRSQLPIIQLAGDEHAGKHAIASAICAAIGLRLCIIAVGALPTAPSEVEALIRLWEREAALSGSALLLDCDELDAGDSARAAAVTRLIEGTNGAILVASRERRRAMQRPVVTFEVRRPGAAEQRAIWQGALGEAAGRLNGQVELLISQFSLDAQAIRAASDEALGRASQARESSLVHTLWDACRAQARPKLDDLAQRIEPAASWDDLVLPEAQRQVLRDIAAHVRQRARVYEAWGFASKGERGLGISALFAGASGTGKTMAAEVIAHELRLDLYRIDLSAMVSKYIGETEKNLRRVFDAAEVGGAILLFDEADALFGKRGEVRDSHDRYANIEVSYLLQRMEAYRGLAVLTTNYKSALDTAFLRRIRFVVSFPFPDAAQR
ncbi:MAG TPA: ATP-binding protein, partial [Roseiflexaceae bacterium]